MKAQAAQTRIVAHADPVEPGGINPSGSCTQTAYGLH